MGMLGKYSSRRATSAMYWTLSRERSILSNSECNPHMRNIGGSSGIAIVTTMLARREQFHQHRLVSHLTPFDPAYTQALAGTAHALASRGASAAQSVAQATGIFYGMMQRQAAMMAFVDCFWVLGIIFLMVIPIMFFMRKAGPHKGPIAME